MTLLKDKSPAEVHLMAARSREELKARLTSIARNHGDRMKQLSGLMAQISASDFDQADTLAGMKGVSLSPELEQLVVNPTKGL